MSVSKSFILSSILIVCLWCTGCLSNTEVNNSTVAQTPVKLESLTIEMIDQTPDSLLVYMIFEHISNRMADHSDQQLASLLALPKAQQVIYITWTLEGEVNNGGFNQFYYNSSGQFAELAPEALKLVGATQYAALTDAANEVYEKNKERITKYQDGTSEGFSKSYENNPLDKFDDQFYVMKEPLMDLQVAYIRKNKKDFVDK